MIAGKYRHQVNRRGWRLVVGAVGLFIVSARLATAAPPPPRFYHYQGKLVTSTGAIMPGPVDLRVRLYDSPSAASPVLFDETHDTVSLNRGLFSILIGSQTPGGMPDTALSELTVYLGVSVDGGAELAPRIQIASAPYSSKSAFAEQLVRPGTVDPGVVLDASGNVGIGTTTPNASAALDVTSSSGGFLPPRMTSAQRDAIAGPAPGLLVFNIDTACIDMWTGTTWKQACFDCTFTPPTAGNNGPICEGETLNLSATTVSGGAYQWSGPNGFSSTLQNPTIANATPAASGPYAVTATLNGCTSNPVTTLATVNPIPLAPTIGSNTPVCAGDTLLLTSSAVPGAIYGWTGPNGFTSNSQNPAIPNVTAAASGMYTLEVTVNGCTSPPASLTAVVNQIPAAPGPITGATTLCRNTSGNVYSINDVPGATTYTWTVPPGATIDAGQGTAFLTVTYGAQSGSITVTAGNVCGTSGATSLAITVQGSSSSQTLSPTGTGRNGAIQNFTVPACVTSVTIEAWGAQGGDGASGAGGSGARMRGDFVVTPGEVLKVLVGHRGVRGGCEGGGGGGSYVTDAVDTPLVIAGGGGGSSQHTLGSGGTTANGGLAGDQGGAGGTAGSGGFTAGGGRGAGGGGGLLGNGQDAGWGAPVTGGLAFVNGGTGGQGQTSTSPPPVGGFGGGGGAHGNCYIGGGGGGGYSGGGSGIDNGQGRGGGGGGSYNAGANQSNSAAAQTGDGQVVISW